MTANDINFVNGQRKLSQVLQFIYQGWPNHCNADLEPFFAKRMELSVYDGCTLWGIRVFIPPPGRDTVLHELHEGHPGITKMKAMPEHTSGGQGLMWRSRSQYVLASAVRKFNLHLQLHLSTLGSGHPCHGRDCIWILRGHLRIKCFSF